MTVEEIFVLTRIDRWFLSKLYRIHVVDQHLSLCQLENLTETRMRTLKIVGFSDRYIGSRLKIPYTQEEIRCHRISQGVRPCVKQIDTLAAEFPASTNYLYLTYQGIEHDVEPLSSATCQTPIDSPKRSRSESDLFDLSPSRDSGQSVGDFKSPTLQSPTAS